MSDKTPTQQNELCSLNVGDRVTFRHKGHVLSGVVTQLTVRKVWVRQLGRDQLHKLNRAAVRGGGLMQLDLRQVRLDLDRKWTPCAFRRWCERAVLVLRQLAVDVELVEVRQTTRGFHAQLTLRDPAPSAEWLVAVQAALGSDGVREALNLTRAAAGRLDDWNLLFQRKAGNEATRSRTDYGGILVRQLRSAGHGARLAPPRFVDLERGEALSEARGSGA